MKFQFTYQSYPSFYIDILLDGNVCLLKESYGGDAVETVLQEQKVVQFWAMVKAIRIDFWKENYSSCVLDGLQWELIIESDFLTKNISGSNEYPDGSCTLKYTPVFDKLKAAVEYLIDDKDFFNKLE